MAEPEPIDLGRLYLERWETLDDGTGLLHHRTEDGRPVVIHLTRESYEFVISAMRMTFELERLLDEDES